MRSRLYATVGRPSVRPAARPAVPFRPPLLCDCYAGSAVPCCCWQLNTDFFVTPPPIAERTFVMSLSVSVCLTVFVSPRTYLRNYTSNLHQFCVHAACVRGSVPLWRRNDTFYTSGFIDDVTFGHKPRLINVAAQLKHITHTALGLAMNCAQ